MFFDSRPLILFLTHPLPFRFPMKVSSDHTAAGRFRFTKSSRDFEYQFPCLSIHTTSSSFSLSLSLLRMRSQIKRELFWLNMHELSKKQITPHPDYFWYPVNQKINTVSRAGNWETSRKWFQKTERTSIFMSFQVLRFVRTFMVHTAEKATWSSRKSLALPNVLIFENLLR